MTEAAARRCRENLRSGSHLSYFYFDVADEFLARGPTTITVQYLDRGAGAWTLHYDSADGALAHAGAYKSLEPVRLTDSGEWRTQTLAVSDARFAGRQNFAADFRIHSSVPLCLARVAVAKGPAAQ